MLQDVVQLVSKIVVLLIVGYARESWDHAVLGADVYRVVDLPVDVAHLPRRVKQALERKQQGSNIRQK